MDNIIAQLEELNENMSRLIELNFAGSLKTDEQTTLMQEMVSNMDRASELQEQMYYQLSNVEERLSVIEDRLVMQTKKDI